MADDRHEDPGKHWLGWGRAKERRQAATKAPARVREVPPEPHHRGSHGPRIRPASTGASLPLIPIAAGIIALLGVAVFNLGKLPGFGHPSASGSTPGEQDRAKAKAVVEAELAVPQTWRKALSFGQVWGTAPHAACGYVGEATSRGEAARRRFIFIRGTVTIDDGSARFTRSWELSCTGQPSAADLSAGKGHPAHRRRASPKPHD